MPLISDQLPNLMNGVSQQAVTMRLPSQAEAQVNGYSSLVMGVNKRNPLASLAKVMDGVVGDAYVHTIDRDSSERYIVCVFDGSIRVFDLEGNEQTVTYVDGANTYVSTAQPSMDIRAITLKDSTFIVNTETVVQKSPYGVSPANGAESQIFIKSVNYDTTYKVYIDGTEYASFTTDDAYGTNPKVSIQEVVDELFNALTTNLPTGWTVTKYSPIIHIEKDDGTEFKLEVTDTNGNTMITAINQQTQRFTDLPVVGKNGYIVKVYGDEGADIDDYYLVFATDTGDDYGSGYWKETVAPGIQTKFDAATMPHVLERKSDGSFEFKRVDWGVREVGTEETAPWPSFTGRKITDIFYDRNRLCFLADDTVCMSRARNLFTFFRETVTTLLDSDPIDVRATGSKVSTLQYAIPFNKQVVIFSDLNQFAIEDEDLLASKPPFVKEVTAYSLDSGAKPVAIGKTVYFAARAGQHTHLMEYYIVPETEATDASDVSKHVPTYIPKDTFKLAASPASDTLLMLNRTIRNRVYVYKYYWQQDQKMQSSHSYWEFDENAVVMNVDFIGSNAYFLIQYPDGVYLEALDFGEWVAPAGEEFIPRIDRIVAEDRCSVAYDMNTGRTTITLPYVPNPETVVILSRPPKVTTEAYTVFDVTDVTGNTVTVKGDLTGQPFYAGHDYAFIYEFSEPVMKGQPANGGLAALGAGRLQLSKWSVNYANTGYFRAVVQPKNRQPYTYVFTGKTIGTSTAVVGGQGLSDGVFSFRVNAKSDRVTITLINDTYLPSYYTSAEWEGRFERKSSRP